jgi:hypothetical protein
VLVRWFVGLLVIGVAGCDLVFTLAPPQDAGGDPIRDAEIDGDVGGLKFGTPVPLVELNTASDEERPSLVEGQLEVYFARQLDIYRSRRATTDAPWSMPERVVEVSTAASEASPCVTSDGLTLYLSRFIGTHWDIFASTRAATDQPWLQPIALPASLTIPPGVNTTSQHEHCGWQSSSGLVLVHESNILNGDREVFRATRTTTRELFASEPLEILNGMSDDGAAWATDDQSIFVFGSNRAGSRFLIYEAIRDGGTYRTVDHPELGEHATSPWLSADGHTIVFSRHTGSDYDLFIAAR